MARPVRWTELAIGDLEQSAQYIARDSEHYAAAFVAGMLEAADSLGEYAGRGREVPELRERGIRELLVGNYRLIYEIWRDTVYVVAVIHGARDLGRLWKRPTLREQGEGDLPAT